MIKFCTKNYKYGEYNCYRNTLSTHIHKRNQIIKEITTIISKKVLKTIKTYG